MVLQMTDYGLPPLDADAGLVRQQWDFGDKIIVEEMTVSEALDQNARAAERGAARGPWFTSDAPDKMLVADDGRPMAVYRSPAARQQLDGNS